MPTIYDVAKKAGVSPKTVSRVLNSDAPVGSKTRTAVEKAIAELGYVPSSAARMMRSNKSGLVGLITGAISRGSEPVEPAGLPDLYIVQGIQSVISASNKTLMIADTGGSAERVPELMQTFLEHRVEGLIYVADHHQHIDLPLKTTRPVVLANCQDHDQTSAVIPDDERGQYELVNDLIAAGHTRIAYLTLRADAVATTRRTRGYENALSEAGIELDQDLLVMSYIDQPDGASQFLWDVIDRLLLHPNPPSVLCCGNDEMALRAYGILRSRGIKVPEDISVAGYDNYRAIAETLYPPLTTVELPYWAMGAKAGQLLLDKIDGKEIKGESPYLVGGPVRWRSSVITKSKKVVNLKLRLEENQ